MPEILQKAVEMAKLGHFGAIKLLLELTLSKPQAVEDAADGKDKVRVTIRNLTLKQEDSKPKPIEGKVLPRTDEVIENVE